MLCRLVDAVDGAIWSRGRGPRPAAALSIDRAAHLERAWQRQAADETRLAEEEAASAAGRCDGGLLTLRGRPSRAVHAARFAGSGW